MFSLTGEAMNEPQRIGGIYVETNLSASNVAGLLSSLHAHFGHGDQPRVKIRHTKKHLD